MHEMSVCQALLEQVECVARERGAGAVKSVRVCIGPLAGVEPSLLEQAYLVARMGTVAESSRLLIDSAPLRVKCEVCGTETEAAPNCLVCATCGDHHTRLLGGDEMMLMDVELLL